MFFAANLFFMTNEQFEALVQKLEPEAARNPQAYRRKVFWLGVLGYGYVLCLLVGNASFFAALFVCCYFFIAHSFNAVAIKTRHRSGSLRRRFDSRFVGDVSRSPKVSRSRRPTRRKLWATMNALREKIAAPPFHQILLTGDFNASVMQRPRLGIFGWSENYLEVGLPLMHTLTKAQFDSVYRARNGTPARRTWQVRRLGVPR